MFFSEKNSVENEKMNTKCIAIIKEALYNDTVG